MDKKIYEKNDLILLNYIIYLIYTRKDLTEMRKELLELLRVLIPFDNASFFLSAEKDDKHALTNPVAINIPDEYNDNYLNTYEDEDYMRWVFKSTKSMAYRESDMISDEKRKSNKYYNEVYKRGNILDSAQVSFAHKEMFLGIITLYRTNNRSEFSDEEIFYLDLLKDHLAYRLYLSKNKIMLPNLGKFEFKKLQDEYGLTNRETEIITLIIEGLTDEAICDDLSISVHTIKKHRLNVYKKLGVTSRWELLTKMK